MKNIEQKIHDNASEVLGDKMPEGHRNRFAARLNEIHKQQETQHKPKKRFLFLPYISYAAAAAAIVVAVILTTPKSATENTNIAETPQVQQVENNDESGENIEEVENYYAMQLDTEIDKTKKLLQKVDAANRAQVLNDIEQMRNDDDDDVPDAMSAENKAAVIVKVYTTKIEAVQQIQSNLLAYN